MPPWVSVWRGGDTLDLGGEGRLGHNTRTDVLRGEDTEFKIELHKRLRSWVAPSQNSAANGLIMSRFHCELYLVPEGGGQA